MDNNKNVREQWTSRLRTFLPGWLGEHEYLAPFADQLTAILHGSTTWGVDDAGLDIDLYGVLPDSEHRNLVTAAGTSFFAFELDGKAGHLNPEPESSVRAAIAGCHMDRIYQLRRSITIQDGMGIAGELTAQARRPMREEVRRRLFFYHYVEMRSEHRSCDNPLERRQPVGLLLAASKALAHALRAAIVLDGEPYPYDKWLCLAAQETETGAQVACHVDQAIAAIESGALQAGGPEKMNPLGCEIREIRTCLIDAARAKGIDAPWLTEWWLHMDAAREAAQGLTW